MREENQHVTMPQESHNKSLKINIEIGNAYNICILMVLILCTLFLLINISFKVYYVVCDASTTRFTQYPATVTSSVREDMVKVSGKCVRNAIASQSEPPTGFCTSSGRWNHLIGECACKPGYMGQDIKGEQSCHVYNYHVHKYFSCRTVPNE
uniref:EGF-like domain-containing protein n=1 Tax=Heterorhabditis bacteriophora TaxID=37862 RepID=A0A1I7X341_HETBA